MSGTNTYNQNVLYNENERNAKNIYIVFDSRQLFDPYKQTFYGPTPPTRKFYEPTPFFPHKPIEIPTNEKIEPYPFLKYKLRI